MAGIVGLDTLVVQLSANDIEAARRVVEAASQGRYGEVGDTLRIFFPSGNHVPYARKPVSEALQNIGEGLYVAWGYVQGSKSSHDRLGTANVIGAAAGIAKAMQHAQIIGYDVSEVALKLMGQFSQEGLEEGLRDYARSLGRYVERAKPAEGDGLKLSSQREIAQVILNSVEDTSMRTRLELELEIVCLRGLYKAANLR